jgi:hypothetical protein
MDVTLNARDRIIQMKDADRKPCFKPVAFMPIDDSPPQGDF